MSGGRIWLGLTGSEALLESDGRSFAEEDFEVTREGRVANGDLVMDVIATKRRFTLTYEVISQTALDTILTEYNRGVILNLKIEREDDSVDEYSVKFRPFSRVRMLAMDQWLWQGVTFLLEEV